VTSNLLYIQTLILYKSLNRGMIYCPHFPTVASFQRETTRCYRLVAIWDWVLWSNTQADHCCSVDGSPFTHTALAGSDKAISMSWDCLITPYMGRSYVWGMKREVLRRKC